MSGALADVRGVSLVEMIFALVILMLIVFMGVPSFREWMQNAQIRGAAEGVHNALQLARNEAVKRNQLVALRLEDTSGGRVTWQVCAWSREASACDEAAPTIQRAQPEGGTANARLSASDNAAATASHEAFASPLSGISGTAVVFNGVGRVEPGTGSIARIDVTNPSMDAADQRRLSVWISQGGQVKTCDPQLAAGSMAAACP